MYLIYQMAKVASRAWAIGIGPAAAREGGEPLHIHYLSPANVEELRTVNAMSGVSQTIGNRLFVREMIRKSAAAASAIGRARERRERIRIVSGMRDPVARSLSLVHFFADFCGDISRPLDRLRGGDGATTAAATREWWGAILAGVTPADSFGRFMTRRMGDYRTWFSEELEASFGVRLGEGPFPGVEGAERLSAEGADVLLYRVEDMAVEAPARRALLAQASDFLEVALTDWPLVNTAATRRSYPRYQAARAALRLDREMLDAIYAAPTVRRFYGEAEIEAFKSQWMAA